MAKSTEYYGKLQNNRHVCPGPTIFEMYYGINWSNQWNYKQVSPPCLLYLSSNEVACLTQPQERKPWLGQAGSEMSIVPAYRDSI